MPGLLANSNSQPTAHEAVLTSKDMSDVAMPGLNMLKLKQIGGGCQLADKNGAHGAPYSRTTKIYGKCGVFA